MFRLRFSLLHFLMVITLLAVAPVWAQTEARLPDSLRRLVATNSKQKIDVIVHGTADEIDAIAARQHLTIKKRMAGGAVFQANGAQIEALSQDVVHLSRDVEVSSFMAVTNRDHALLELIVSTTSTVGRCQ